MVVQLLIFVIVGCKVCPSGSSKDKQGPDHY
jgi:hypothetical protein